jgi:hypothetical protein
MKKFLAMVAIAATFAACNDGANSETETTDTSTFVTQDTMQVITDTTITRDTTDINNN